MIEGRTPDDASEGYSPGLALKPDRALHRLEHHWWQQSSPAQALMGGKVVPGVTRSPDPPGRERRS